MTTERRPRVLCVDDEPFVRDGISRLIRRDYDMVCADGAAEALTVLAANEAFDVIMSDLRMPGMDGIELLKRARKLAPDTVRLLFTGFADIDAAIQGVNDAQIFRFLTKPCSRDQLLGALQSAIAQHRLITAERVLLEQTLHGCIRALTDALALANPVAFGRASRVKLHAADLAVRLDVPDRWQLEVAAMVSQLGMISLPARLVEKLFSGARLDAAEAEAVERVPAITDQLLANVPRLEGVREIVRLQNRRYDAVLPGMSGEEATLAGARILKVVANCDMLETQGHPPDVALDIMRRQTGVYDPAILDAFSTLRGIEQADYEVRELPLDAVLPGMRLMDDVRTRNGLLLIPKGFEMNAALRERMLSYDPIVLQTPVRVVVGGVLEAVA